MTFGNLLLGEIVSQQVLTRFEHFSLLKHPQQATNTEELIRLGRDLHNGLLQSLKGAASKLETVYRLMEVDLQTARQRFLEIQRPIAAEQRDLRSQIQALKPSPPKPLEMESELTTRLKELAEQG